MSGAFGKDNKHLESVDNFRGASSGSMRQRSALVRQTLDQQHQGRGGGGGGMFSDRFQPPIGEVEAAVIRLLPGSYDYVIARGDLTTDVIKLEYWPYIEHFHGTKKRGCICSGGPFHFKKDKREECIGCSMYFDGMERGPDGKMKKGPMSKREMFAFSVIHYWPYHKIEQTDDKGNVRMNDKNEPYYEWAPCDDNPNRTNKKLVQCVMCKAGKERKDAHRMHWPMGGTHFKYLTEEVDKMVSTSCSNCGGRETIGHPLAYLCKGCGDAIIDMSTTELPDADIAKIVSGPVKCPQCGHHDFLDEAIQCSGCDSPRRASLFDVDLKVKRIETSREGAGGKATQLVCVGFGSPSPIDQRFSEMSVPFDLPKMYAATPVEKQRERFEVTESNTAFRPSTKGPNYGG